MQHVPMTKVVQIRKHLERGEEPEAIAQAYKIPVERVLGFAVKKKTAAKKVAAKKAPAKKVAAKKAPVKKKSELEQDAAEEGTTTAAEENWEE